MVLNMETKRDNLMHLDDKLEVIAEKTMTDGSGRKLNLSKDWRAYTSPARDNQGQIKIYSYWNGEKGEKGKCIAPDEYQSLPKPEQESWIPCFEREVSTSIPNTFVRARDNHFFVRICGLSSEKGRLLKSRYRGVVEVIHDLRPFVLDYKNRGGDERAFFESSRNIIKRNFRLYEYEYDILFLNKELGQRVYQELEKTCDRQFEGTLYIKGFNAKKKAQGDITIKMYDHGALHGPESGLYKLEFTIRKKSFNKLNLQIEDMDCIEQIKDCIEQLKGEVMAEVMKLKGGPAVQEFQLALFQEDNILARIVRLEQKTEGHDRAIDSHDRAIEELRKQVAELKARSKKKA